MAEVSDSSARGDFDGDQTVDSGDQLPLEDMLSDAPIDDVLDEGYSPPDRPPLGYRDGRVEAETLEEKLAEEEPDVDPYLAALGEDDPDDSGDERADPRAGRLVAPDEGLGEDVDSDEIARDVGVDGAGASAEEAAMHVIGEDE